MDIVISAQIFDMVRQLQPDNYEELNDKTKQEVISEIVDKLMKQFSLEEIIEFLGMSVKS